MSSGSRIMMRCYFNPLPPHGGRRCTPTATTPATNFNPLPPHGGRLFDRHFLFPPCRFQSTPSAWRETSSAAPINEAPVHFNPLPPHGGRLATIRVTSDTADISIHSLRMEGDHFIIDNIFRAMRFQSTPSAWRETILSQNLVKANDYFNPLPPHGGRQISCQ